MILYGVPDKVFRGDLIQILPSENLALAENQPYLSDTRRSCEGLACNLLLDDLILLILFNDYARTPRWLQPPTLLLSL